MWLRHVKPRKNKQSKKKRISVHICMHRGVLDEKNYFLGKSQWALAEKRYAYRRLLLTKQLSMSNINWKTVLSSSLFLSATLAPSAIFLLTLQKKIARVKSPKVLFYVRTVLLIEFPKSCLDFLFWKAKLAVSLSSSSGTAAAALASEFPANFCKFKQFSHARFRLHMKRRIKWVTTAACNVTNAWYPAPKNPLIYFFVKAECGYFPNYSFSYTPGLRISWRHSLPLYNSVSHAKRLHFTSLETWSFGRNTVRLSQLFCFWESPLKLR